jgi:hypothetical protein
MKPTKCTNMFFRYLCYNITLNVLTCFDPQGTIIRESNEGNYAFNKIKLLCTKLACFKRVKQLKCRSFFGQLLNKYARS